MAFRLPRTSALRTVAAVAALAVAVLIASPACSGDDTGSATTTTTASSSSGSSSTGPSVSADPNAPTTISDLGGVTGPVGDCLKLAAKFSNLVQGVLEGADGARRSQQAAEQMKADLPPSLQADADAVAATFGRIADNGGQLTDADLNDAGYRSAVKNLGDWFAHDCKR